ncbi:MAG: hypothetical protein WKF84_15910 [Pyrinomonadaceae bacterium]
MQSCLQDVFLFSGIGGGQHSAWVVSEIDEESHRARWAAARGSTLDRIQRTSAGGAISTEVARARRGLLGRAESSSARFARALAFDPALLDSWMKRRAQSTRKQSSLSSRRSSA